MGNDSIFVARKIPNINKNSKWADWDLIMTSSIYKGSARTTKMKKEIVKGYFKAAQMIQTNMEKNNHFHNYNGERMSINFLEVQTCLPFLFLIRHTVELSIKYRLDKQKIDYNKDHNLKGLWRLVNKRNLDAQNCDRYDSLIKALCYTDKDGLGFRYIFSKKEDKYIKDPFFINIFNLTNWTELLMNELLK